MFQWLVFEKKDGKEILKAGFLDELDAMNYADMLRNISRMAGYKQSYIVKPNN